MTSRASGVRAEPIAPPQTEGPAYAGPSHCVLRGATSCAWRCGACDPGSIFVRSCEGLIGRVTPGSTIGFVVVGDPLPSPASRPVRGRSPAAIRNSDRSRTTADRRRRSCPGQESRRRCRESRVRPPPATDQRGLPRLAGFRVDMGAVELHAVVPPATVPALGVLGKLLLALSTMASALWALGWRE